MNPRFSLLVGAGGFVLGACSTEPAQEKPVKVVYTRISLDSPRRVATAPDTVTPGRLYVRKVFLTSNALRQIAAATGYPYTIRTKAFTRGQPPVDIEHVLVGDTCYLKLDAALVKDADSLVWQCNFAIDYQNNKPGADTTFALVDNVIIRK